MKKFLNKIWFKVLIAFLGLVFVNFLAEKWHTRLDLTSDKRYTLSEITQKTLLKIHKPIQIDVLLKGNIPPEFKKLQTETLQLLEEYTSQNKNINVNFVNPIENEENATKNLQELVDFGLNPLQISQKEAGKTSIEYIFPWAVINDGTKSEKVSLFTNKLGATDQERVQTSVQRLEYNLTDALHKLTLSKKKKIAVLRSNGTLEDIYIADFLQLTKNYYYIAPFTLDSVATNPEKTLRDLKQFDLLIVAKPTEAFSDAQKQIIDQFVMHGGRILWLIDNVAISIEDLYNPSGSAMAMPLNLNLTDLFFQYGFRINYNLINDLYFSEILIASGQGSQTRYVPLPWVYNPMILSKNNHLITNNLDAIRLQFANQIDTLKNAVKKTILMESSEFSKVDGTPREISLNIDTKKLDRNAYKKGKIPTAVLLEGEFTSVYKGRIRPIEITDNQTLSKPTKMIVVADGDIIKNDIANGSPLELGLDKWSNKFYENKAFLQNSVNYLLDDISFLNLRNKKVQLAFLDKEKVAENQRIWKIKSIIYPLFCLLVIFFLVRFFYLKKNKKKQINQRLNN